MKEATKPKTSSQKAPAKKKHEDGRAERNDKRVHVALPLRITFWDKEKKPGLEMACTYDISPRGARISRLRCVKETGEIVAIERGRNKSFCRVVWVGDPNSELSGQIGLQCVESDRPMFEVELRELENVFEPVTREATAPNSTRLAGGKNRRQQDRIEFEGVAELLKPGRNGEKVKLKNVSELGCLVTTREVLLPGTDLKLVLHVSNYKLNVKGKVRHSALDLGIGIEFTEMRKGDQNMLKYLLQKIEDDNLEEVIDVDAQP